MDEERLRSAAMMSLLRKLASLRLTLLSMILLAVLAVLGSRDADIGTGVTGSYRDLNSTDSALFHNTPSAFNPAIFSALYPRISVST